MRYHTAKETLFQSIYLNNWTLILLSYSNIGNDQLAFQMVSMCIEFVTDPRQKTFSKHAEQLWKRTKLHMHDKKKRKKGITWTKKLTKLLTSRRTSVMAVSDRTTCTFSM